MLKLFLILLIFTSCCHLSIAKEDINKQYAFVFNSDNLIKIKSQEYDNLSIELVESSPFIQNLINFGGQVVVGHAGDSGLLEDSYLSTAYYQPFGASISEGEDLNITADVLITINSWVVIHSQFLVNFDPVSYNRKILSFSFEWQKLSFDSISGYNISYVADQDLYEAIPFNGLEDLLTYKTKNLSNVTTTYSSQDFKEKFSNWTSLNASEIYDNQTLQYGFNTALRTIRSWSLDNTLISTNYDDLNVTAMHSIHTFYAPEEADVFRYDFDFKTTNQSGRLVCVVYCSVYSLESPPYWPPYYPQYPLSVLDNGDIISNKHSEAIGADAYYEGYEEEEEYYYIEEEVEESNESNQNSTVSTNNSTTNATSAQPTNTSLKTYYNFNCLYSELRYYWLVEFARTDKVDL